VIDGFGVCLPRKLGKKIEPSLDAYFEVKEKRITAVHSTASNNWKKKKNSSTDN